MLKGAVQEHVQLISLAAIMLLFACTIAWRLGYFRLPPPESDQKYKMPFSVMLGAFVTFFIVEFLFIPAVVGIVLFIQKGHLTKADASSLDLVSKGWVNLSSMLVATGAVLAYTFCIRKDYQTLIWNYSKPVYKLWKSILIGCLSWLISYPVVVLVGQLFALLIVWVHPDVVTPTDQVAVKYLKTLFSHPVILGLNVASVIFIVPIAEELIFRGFLQSWIRSHLGRLQAIIYTSLLFAFLHYSPEQGIANWELLSSLVVLSCFLGFVYERQRTLWASIALHATFNGLSVLLIFWKQLASR